MTKQTVAIIGAGLAGCATAYELSLSDNNFAIEIFDKNCSIAAEASGNYAGILAPYLTSDNNFSDQFHTAGFSLLTQFIEKYRSRLAICNYGVVEILSNNKSLQRYQKIFARREITSDLAKLLDANQASELLKTKISSPAVYYPKASSLIPKSLCKLWVELSEAKLKLDSKLLGVSKTKNNRWQLAFEGFTKDFDIVIFAGSYNLFRQISYLSDIPVYPSHGQLTLIKGCSSIKKTVINNGYIIPSYADNLQVIGATFRANADTNEIRKKENIYNLTQLKTTFSNLSLDNTNIISSRVATRCVTSDHLPIVGRLVAYERFKALFYKPLSKGYPKSKMPTAEYEDNLYVASGFGSKGLCSSLISAKIIASQITNTKSIASDKLLNALSPQRFWIRNFKKS